MGISKPRADDCNQENELGLTEKEEGQEEEGGDPPPLEKHIHSPVLFVIVAYLQCFHHHITKPRACLLTAQTSLKLLETIKAFLLQVLLRQRFTLWQ